MVSFKIKNLTLSTTTKESFERENYLQSASLDMYMWGTDLCAALLRSEATPPSSRCPGPASGRGSLGPPPAARPLYPRPAARERPPRHRRLIGQWVLTCFAKENTPFINKSSESVQHISKSSVFFKIWFRYHCLFQTKNIFQNSIDSSLFIPEVRAQSISSDCRYSSAVLHFWCIYPNFRDNIWRTKAHVTERTLKKHSALRLLQYIE